MTLENIFPDFEVIREPTEGFPPEWNRLLGMSPVASLSAICDCMGLGAETKVRSIVTSSSDIAILRPKRKRDKNLPYFRRLGVTTAADLAMYFTPPAKVETTHRYPPGYTTLVESIGPLYFTQFGGNILSPLQIQNAREQIRTSIEFEGSIRNSLVPFYDHETGDFDCWQDDDCMECVFFDHETQDLTFISRGEFSNWIEKRFLSFYEM
ncbi:hypothetical protein [Lignipirellula cremea]|uniref:SMI1 / KNR4 family protein n=1 Tax=Lignipirellula cremea TaxID=2528010 RepID=A0A518DV04_9BACT|nr:hypothetical protein [Lignipirellula cremea]QDU95671.1 hypothetical protein Pla8534_34880 [Lignipirellula cremea]